MISLGIFESSLCQFLGELLLIGSFDRFHGFFAADEVGD
jgi:hypothetical protein